MTVIPVSEESRVASDLWMSGVGEYIKVRKVWDPELGRLVRDLLKVFSQSTRLESRIKYTTMKALTSFHPGQIT